VKILAIDTTGQTASAALLENDVIVAEYSIHYKMTHSQTILPMIDEISHKIELDLSTQELEFKNEMFPVNIIFDSDEREDWADGYKDFYNN